MGTNRHSQRPTRPPPPTSPVTPPDEEEDRPTLVPEFDVAEFARKKMLAVATPSPISVTNGPDLSSASTDLGELFRAGDHETTLAVCEAVLQQDPDDAEAKRYAELARQQLAGQAGKMRP